MNLIDTHSHIYSKEFNGDIQEIIENSKEAGVEKILLPNIDSESIEPMHALEEMFPGYCIPMMGLHPTSVKENYEEELALCKNWLESKKYCAVGEIGIDLYWDKSFVKEQQIAFDTQINWALQYNLPIVIHSRESFDEIFEILDNYKDSQLKGVFHSFSGNIEQANKAIELGFLLGINGIVTFKNSGLDKTVAQVPPEKLMLETDAPYLAPVPKRGKRNESSYVRYTANKIAEIYQTDISKVAEITSRNARNLFKL
ncbi:TatD family hydrolase [Marinifilum caeruleilacunae]|uniref:TatD family deoxyribonuclease n=1 Tax=Marinifilum caeruleilacunae TaxID=2499076 RepID=A0ABX1WZR7_9BACT|nr:TatD family hydrolase [Marinifilum caeruleilacunae]NOU61665.1 TatD family deoxyribonuclease [Marinifilum caeruleilacunae]